MLAPLMAIDTVAATLTLWPYTGSSCWIIIEQKVYDVTDFVSVSVCLPFIPPLRIDRPYSGAPSSSTQAGRV